METLLAFALLVAVVMMRDGRGPTQLEKHKLKQY